MKQLLQCGLCIETSKDYSIERRVKRVTLQWRNLTHYLSQVIEVNINTDVMLILCALDMM